MKSRIAVCLALMGSVASPDFRILGGTEARADIGHALEGGVDRRVNDNAGASTTTYFTQSTGSLIAFGNVVVVGFDDSGSNAGGTNKFTGFAYSTDGGATFIDGGTLPTNANGDVGEPMLARNQSTGRIYLSTLGFSSGVQVFRSDNQGDGRAAPVSGAPGSTSVDWPALTVDNFTGVGNGNVYLMCRDFSFGHDGIYFYRSTDHGNTFGPGVGTSIVTAGNMQFSFLVVGPDHSVYAFWWAGTSLQVRKSTDRGLTFAAPVTVTTGLTAPDINGGLGLTGVRQGTGAPAGFRTNSYPHAAANPVNGHLYVTFNDNPAGTDKADVYMVMSTDGGATWSARVRINDDATTTDQWRPTLAVSPAGNRLGIFYYSRQEDPTGNNLFRYYGRIATIAGATVTFAPSSPISDTPSLPEFGRDGVVNSVYMGFYNIACATTNAFHVVWADNRDDLIGGAPRKDPNVYYDKILLSTVDVPGGDRPPAAELGPAAPNPFLGVTTLAFDLAEDADVTVAVFSPTGARVRTLAKGRWSAGRHHVEWNGENSAGSRLPAGVYFVRLVAGSHTSHRKVVMVQ